MNAVLFTLCVQVDRSREKLLPVLFAKLNQYGEQPHTGLSSSPPLCIHRFKVTFVGEPGEGSGVLRSLFTATTEVSWSPSHPYSSIRQPLALKL